MSEPEPEICRCGRPRATPEQLKRWRDEIEAHRETGASGAWFNPTWAKALCWSNRPIGECNMRPLAKDKMP